MNIFKFIEGILDIYCQNEDMADFPNLIGAPDLTAVILIPDNKY